MYAIIFFGALMILLSINMIINPSSWSGRIIHFSERWYFHPFEIVTRLGFGVVFIRYSEQTLYPNFILAIGYLLTAVGIGLLLTPPSKHRQFALWSAHKFKNSFRAAGIGSFFFGVFLIYTSLIKIV